MTTTAPSPHAPVDRPARAVDAPRPPRPLGRRRTLPGSRSVVGGLLVTLAAIGTFVAATSAGSGPAASVVVAARPISIGERIDAGAVRTVPADLPDDVLATAFSSPGDLVGAVALAPLAADQAVARTAVRLDPTGAAVRTHDLSFALERDRALNGRIQPGERVDLVATFGSGADATTEIVVRGARVANLDGPGSATASSSSKITVTLALDTEDDVVRVANALEVASVTLSRNAGAAPGGGPDGAGSAAPGREERDGAGTGTTTPTTTPPTTSSAPPSGSGSEATPTSTAITDGGAP